MNENKLMLEFLSNKFGTSDQKEIQKKLNKLDKEQQQALAQEYQQWKAKKKTKAAHGAKLDYVKSLKHICPEGEELVYFKQGGSVKCGCVGKKLEEGAKVEKASTGAVAKFKTKRMLIGGDVPKTQPKVQKKLDPKTTEVLPNGKYPDYWTSQQRQIWEREHGDNDEGAATVSGIEHTEQPLPVKVKKQTKSSNNKPKPIVPKAKTSLQKCGGEIKKVKCGAVAKFKAARCGAKMKKK